MKIGNEMPSSLRSSMNVSVGKQTQGSTFGEKVSNGLQQAGGALANGAAMVGGAFGGAAGAGIVSAAVSSVSTMTGGAYGSASMAATGSVNLAGGSTTLGSVGAGGNMLAAGGSSGSPNLTQGMSSNNVGSQNNAIANQSGDIQKMLDVQIAMQKENQVFTSVSNVLKTKHDTVKNSISNVR